MFLAQPLVSAAVSGVVLLRRCESQADFSLAVVVFMMTVLRLMPIRPHSLKASMHGFLSHSRSGFKLPVSFYFQALSF